MQITVHDNLPRLHFVAGKDELRQAMLYIQIKDNKAYVTNAHIALIADLVGYMSDRMPDCYILATDWKKICGKGISLIIGDGIIDIVSKNKTEIIKFIPADKFYEKVGVKFPDIDVVIPDKDEKVQEGFDTIGLRSDILSQFASVAPMGRFAFKFIASDKCIRVDSIGISEPLYGAVMPCLISNY
jgi:hypothetical protein